MASDVIGDVTSGRTGESETPAPLTGLVVVEIGHSLTAPYAGRFSAIWALAAGLKFGRCLYR